MKLHSRWKIAPVVAFALVAGSCGDGLTEVNRNPNAPTDVGAEFLLPQAIQGSVNLALGYMHLDMTGVWAQHHAEIQYAEEDIGQVRSPTVNNRWETFYAGPLADLQLMIEKGQADDRPNVTAVAMIMKAWTFSIMTDLWGDIPYSQALEGADNIVPVFDPQQEIYMSLLANLAEASEMIVVGGPSFGNEDLLYGGDMESWRRFANSLRLRLAMRLAYVEPATAQAEFAAALNAPGGVFTSNAYNAMFRYLPDVPNQNPLFVNFKTRDDHRVSERIIQTLKELDDPRLPVYAMPAAATGEYRGMPNGLEEHEIGFTETSKLGYYFSLPNAPAPIMQYPEVLFLQAEAAERGWPVSGSAQMLYRQAITASMELYDGVGYIIPGTEDEVGTAEITDAEIQAYLSQPAVAYEGIESIGRQKWIALFGNGTEAWSEWRRLGVPDLTPGPDNVLGQIPTRYPYPDLEESFNNDNLQAAIARQGEAGLLGHVWWDVTTPP